MIGAAILMMMFQANWEPPSRQMPQMPAAFELPQGWRGDLASWFRDLDEPLSGISAEGDRRGERPRVVRFASDSAPAEIWTDRNGDGRADRIEVFRGGARVYELVDSDFDGMANVLRVYDEAGALQQEQRF